MSIETGYIYHLHTIYSYNRCDCVRDVRFFAIRAQGMGRAPSSAVRHKLYFYHSDHLGSASWITDSAGAPVQHLQYLPYGEEFLNQRTSGYSERYTFTGKERDKETGYGYFGARYMDHELMTMWLSVDPMADKYPSISPYAYCAWNPVKLVDPDGMEIIIMGRKGSTRYTPGMSDDGLDKFTKKTINALNTIYGTDIGKVLIDDLCGSSNIFKIVKNRDNGFDKKDIYKAHKKQFMTDPKLTSFYDAYDNKSIFNGGSGGVVKWNPYGEILPTTEGGKINATVDLAHELFHAMDSNHGILDDRLENGIKRTEWQAVYNENILRMQMELPLRTHFMVKQDSHGYYLGGAGPLMLKEGKPIKPMWL